MIFVLYIIGWLNLLAIRIGEPRDLGKDVCVGGVCVPNGGCVSYQDAYVTALYYSCTSLTTVGFGNVSANTKWERIFSVVIMLIGGMYYIRDWILYNISDPGNLMNNLTDYFFQQIAYILQQ